MAKSRRKSSRKPNVLGLVIFLIVSLVVGYLYWQQQEKLAANPGRHITAEDPLDEQGTGRHRRSHHISAEEPSEPVSDAQVESLFHRYDDNPSKKYVYAGAPRPLAHQSIKVLTNLGYAVGYSEEAKDPLWVGCRIFRHNPHHIHARPGEFMPDTRTYSQVNESAYSRSDLDRGHMAPNSAIADCSGDEAQRQTFLMTNVVPQRKLLNREVWKKLEEKIEDEWAMGFEEVWVLTGPVFADHPDTLPQGVQIPDQCYKIVIHEQSGRPVILAFVIPQSVGGHEPLDSFLTSVRQVEQKTRLDFFPDLPRQEQDSLETSAASAIW